MIQKPTQKLNYSVVQKQSLIFFFFPLTDIWNSLDRIEEMHEVTALNFISLLFSWKHSPFCTRGSSWALWIVSTPEKWHSNVKPKKGKLIFLTQHYGSCCRWIYSNKKHDFLFTLNHFIWENHIISQLKSLYFNWVWPPGCQEMCPHQSESVAYQPVLVVWI